MARGPVTELWHVQNPLNDTVPMPDEIYSMEQWGQVVITMQKYAGKMFQMLDKVRVGDRMPEVLWLDNGYMWKPINPTRWGTTD